VSRLAIRVGVALACAACGNPTAQPPPPPEDAPEPIDAAVPDGPAVIAPPMGLPDLQLVASLMTNSWVVSSDVFPANDCAVVEGCVGGSGLRLLLRFDTVTANIGAGDVQVGAPPAPGVSNDMFQWSQCHMHHHVTRYTTYELLGPGGVVFTGRKQSFCLEDVQRTSPGLPSRGYTCLNQGISRGWADSYSRGLPCQWIDITDIPSGDYTLRVTVNPDHTLPESDYTNNELTFDVHF
jgi:Lysyl oxidase